MPHLTSPRSSSPDLGLMYRRNGCESSASICFLGLEIAALEQPRPGVFSATVQMPWGRCKQLHSLTLDFDGETLAQLLRALDAGDRRRAADRLHEPAATPLALARPLRARVVEGCPGELRRLADGASIVPFQVTRFEAMVMAAAA